MNSGKPAATARDESRRCRRFDPSLRRIVGAGADALALAVVCQVVFGDGQDAVLDAAAARMEQYHGNKPIPRLWAGRWAESQSMPSPIWTAQDDPRIAQQHLQRADELLRQFRCDDHAYRSRADSAGLRTAVGSIRRADQSHGQLGIQGSAISAMRRSVRRRSPSIGEPSSASETSKSPAPKWPFGWFGGCRQPIPSPTVVLGDGERLSEGTGVC